MHLSDISKSDRIKINLAAEITKRIAATSLSQRDVSKKIGLSRTKIVAMKNGEVDGISLEKMLTILERLDERVAILLGDDARETRIEYETDEERYLRVNGDGPIPAKYTSGFVVNLADVFSVEISANPQDWEKHQLSFGSIWEDIYHRPEDRVIEQVLRAMVCTVLRAGEADRSINQYRSTFDLARSSLRLDRTLTPRLDRVLQRAHRVVTEMSRDISKHQRALASFEKSMDQDEEASLVTFDR